MKVDGYNFCVKFVENVEAEFLCNTMSVRKTKNYTALNRHSIHTDIALKLKLKDAGGVSLYINGDIIDSWSDCYGEGLRRYTYHQPKYRTFSFSVFESFIEWLGYTNKDYSSWLDILKTVDTTKDVNANYHNHKNINVKDVPKGATIHWRNNDEGKRVIHSYHLPASILVKGKKKGSNKYYYALAGMDNGSYFLCVLSNSKSIKTIEETFDSLTPKEITRLTRSGTKITRQGEWYFHKIMDGVEAEEMYKTMDRGFILPKKHPDSNNHRCTRGKILENGDIVVSGTVQHPEHGNTVLNIIADEYLIFKAYENTAVMSWGVKYKVD